MARLTTPSSVRSAGSTAGTTRWTAHRVASPMPPARSGVATYSRAVLEGLERIGYRPRSTRSSRTGRSSTSTGRLPWHTMAVYHLGNNRSSTATSTTRDPNAGAPGDPRPRARRLRDGMVATAQPFGHQAMREGPRSRPGSTGSRRPNATPASPTSRAARNARGIIVHSPFAERYLRAFGCKTPIYVAPHPVVESEPHVRRRRAPLA